MFLRDDLSHPFTAAAVLSPNREPNFTQPDQVRRVYLLHGAQDVVLPIQRVRQGTTLRLFIARSPVRGATLLQTFLLVLANLSIAVVKSVKDSCVGLALDFRQVEGASIVAGTLSRFFLKRWFAEDHLLVAGLSHAFPEPSEVSRLLAWWHKSLSLPGEEIPTAAEPTFLPTPNSDVPIRSSTDLSDAPIGEEVG